MDDMMPVARQKKLADAFAGVEDWGQSKDGSRWSRQGKSFEVYVCPCVTPLSQGFDVFWQTIPNQDRLWPPSIVGHHIDAELARNHALKVFKELSVR